MAFEEPGYYDKQQNKQEETVTKKLLRLRERFIDNEAEKSDELDAIEEELDDRGVEYTPREELKKDKN